jgi:hypothetical protein
MRIFFGAALALLLLPSCATIVKGTTQTIAINSPGAAGARCQLRSGAIGTVDVVTPATVTLEKSQENITVHCTKECFQDGAGIVTSFTEGLAAGNIIAGGVIGLGIDAASGAMNKYAPETIIVMTPIQGCRATG